MGKGAEKEPEEGELEIKKLIEKIGGMIPWQKRKRRSVKL